MSDIKFGKACLNDLEDITGMFMAAIRRMRESGIDQWDELYPTEADIREDIEKEQLYVCRLSGEISSAAVLNENQDPEYGEVAWEYRGGKICVIHRLCVHPGEQGRGLGKKSVIFLEDTAAGLGYDHVRLDTFSGNRAAVALYKSLGYRYAGDVFFRKGRFFCFEKTLKKEEKQ